MAATSPPRPIPAHAVRHLGRFQLLRLLGKSEVPMGLQPVARELGLVLDDINLDHPMSREAWHQLADILYEGLLATP